jgi:NADPH:quinone reductase-like Zn-dependent oxidoreductase
MAHNCVGPLIDREFGFDDADQAFQHFAERRHTGKVVIRID